MIQFAVTLELFNDNDYLLMYKYLKKTPTHLHTIRSWLGTAIKMDFYEDKWPRTRKKIASSGFASWNNVRTYLITIGKHILINTCWKITIMRVNETYITSLWKKIFFFVCIIHCRRIITEVAAWELRSTPCHSGTRPFWTITNLHV